MDNHDLFYRLWKVSPALSEFLGIDPNSKVSCAEVKCFILKYIRDANNHIDDKLIKLFSLESNYLEESKLDTYIKYHLIEEYTHPSNSTFLQPCKITPALAHFCGVSNDTMISRIDATRAIASYIRTNNLQNPENIRKIIPDATLTKLFSLGPEDKLNYFNIQRYIKPHFY